MGYEEFKRDCEASGLAGVTEDEFKAHAPDAGAGKNWSLMTAMRRIRNARKGVGKSPEMLTVVGYPLGGREFVPRDGSPSWKQFIPVLVPGKGIVELDYEGEYPGKMGTRTEFRYEETTKPKKSGEGAYTNRTIKESAMGKEHITIDMLRANAIPIDKLEERHLDQPVILVGRISDQWYNERTYGDDGKPDGDWPLIHKGQPCFQFGLVPGEVNTVKCRFTARDISRPVIEFPELLAVAEKVGTVGELAVSFADAEVIVAGKVSRFEQSRRGDGNFVQVMVTGIWEIPAAPAQAKLGEPVAPPKKAKPEPKPEPKHEPTPEEREAATQKEIAAAGGAGEDDAPAPAPEPAKAAPAPPAQPAAPAPAPAQAAATAAPKGATSGIAERMKIIREGVRKTANAVGGLDKVTVANAKELNAKEWTWGPSDHVIEIAIKKEKGLL